MASVNKVILLGNLGRDPEVRYTPGGDAVASMSIATTESWKDKGGQRQFADWISERIQKYGFVENQDFVIFSQNCEKPKGGRPAKEFALTLDMAKELAMVENNDKGKQAREAGVGV